jgi:hypothetical protein
MHSINADLAWDIAFFLNPEHLTSFSCVSKSLNEVLDPIVSKHSRLWIEKIKDCCVSQDLKNNFNGIVEMIQSAKLVMYDKVGNLQKSNHKLDEPVDWKTRYLIFTTLQKSALDIFGELFKYELTYIDFSFQRMENPVDTHYRIDFTLTANDPLIFRDKLSEYEVVLKGFDLHLFVTELFRKGTPEMLSVMLERWIGEGKSNLNYIAKRLVTEKKDNMDWIMSMILPHINLSTLKHALNTATELKLTKILKAILTHPKLPKILKPKTKPTNTNVPIVGVKGKRLLY